MGNPKITNEICQFLENLRHSGETNMYGASPYLQGAFGLDKRTADSYLLYWMQNYQALIDNGQMVRNKGAV